MELKTYWRGFTPLQVNLIQKAPEVSLNRNTTEDVILKQRFILGSASEKIILLARTQTDYRNLKMQEENDNNKMTTTIGYDNRPCKIGQYAQDAQYIVAQTKK